MPTGRAYRISHFFRAGRGRRQCVGLSTRPPTARWIIRIPGPERARVVVAALLKLTACALRRPAPIGWCSELERRRELDLLSSAAAQERDASLSKNLATPTSARTSAQPVSKRQESRLTAASAWDRLKSRIADACWLRAAPVPDGRRARGRAPRGIARMGSSSGRADHRRRLRRRISLRPGSHRRAAGARARPRRLRRLRKQDALAHPTAWMGARAGRDRSELANEAPRRIAITRLDCSRSLSSSTAASSTDICGRRDTSTAVDGTFWSAPCERTFRTFASEASPPAST